IVSVNEASYENEDVDDEVTDEQTVSTNFAAVEIVSLRDENIKAYSMADHTVKVCYYSEPVNYKNDEGVWETIDNRLHFSYPDDFSDYYGYKNNASDVDIKFAAEANENRLFTIGDGDVSASFRYVKNADKGMNDIEESRNRKEESNAGEDETTSFQDDDIEPVGDGDLEEDIPLGAETGSKSGNINQSRSYRTVSDNGMSWSSKIRLVSNTGKSGEDKIADPILGGYDNEQETPSDTDESKDQIPSLPIPQTVWYEDIEENVSLRYEMLGSGIKESIIIDSPHAPDSYSFDIDGNGQKLERADDGSVVFKNDDEICFIIPAPVVTDGAGVRDEGAYFELRELASTAVSDEIESSGVKERANSDTIGLDKEHTEHTGNYRLILHLSDGYLTEKNRVFPVDADPTIEKYRKFSGMDSLGKFVSIGSDGSIRKQHLYTGIDKVRGKDNVLPEDSDTAQVNVPDSDDEEDDPQDTDTVTPDGVVGIHYRTYMKFNLPEIPMGSVVTGATLRLKSIKKSGDEKYYYAVYADTDDIKDNEKNLLGMNWNTQPLDKLDKGELIPFSDLNVIDYGSKGTDELDITAAVRGWVDGTRDDDCLCLIMSNETSSNVGKKKEKGKVTDEIKTGMRQIEPAKSKKKPFFTIEYKDFTGTEDYWSSHTQTAGNAGSSAINDFTGRLTFVHQDAASAGERMPLSLTHVYDVSYGDRADDKKWQTAEDGSAFGLHWHLSTDVRLLVPVGETKVEDYPYVYIDSDGTKHYFKNQKVVYYANGSKQTANKNDDEYPGAADEDGLGLFVVPVNDAKLKDLYPLKIVDKSSSTVMYFDRLGYLGMITDSNQREDGGNAKEKELNAITFTHKASEYNPSYSAEKAKAETEGLNQMVSSIKDTADNLTASVEKANNVIAKIDELEEKALVYSVSYKAAHALDTVRGHMQDIIDNSDISAGSVKELAKKSENELDDILDLDFNVYPQITTKVTDAAGQKAELSYNSKGLLESMSDPSEGQDTIKYTYDDAGRLTDISHPCGTKAIYAYWDTDCLSGVMDECGSALIYNYDSHKRIVKVNEYSFATPKDSEKKLNKAAKKLVNEVAVTHKNLKKNKKSKIKGQSICVSYENYNETAYVFTGADDALGNADDIENIYCFDNKGRTVNVYTRNVKTKRVSGGQAFTYADKADDGEDAVNKIKDSAVLGSPIVNYVADSGFEKKKKDTDKWTINAGAGDADIVTSEKYLGKKSAHIKLKNPVDKDNMPYFEQEVRVPFTGNYTASVYVKTKDMVNAHVRMSVSSKNAAADSDAGPDAVSDDAGDDSGEGAEDDPDADEEEEADEDSTAKDGENLEFDSATPAEIDNGWKRLESTIKVKKGQVITLRLGLYGDGGEAFFDCVQVEKGDLANQYNLLPNSGFEGNYASGIRANVIPEGWAYANKSKTVDASLVTNKELGNENKVIEGKKALCIKGSEDENKVLLVNPNFGSGNASYTFSCYVKADCAPVRGNRKVGIYIPGDMPEFDEDTDPDLVEYIKKHIDVDDLEPAAYTEINTSVKGWQYVEMALPGRNWSGKRIEIHFDHECGTLCIDACTLTRNGVDVRTYSSSGKLITKKGNERVTRYATDNRDRTKKQVMAGGAKQVYTYDKDTNDVTSVKNVFSQPGRKVSKTNYTYDKFGNVINTEITWNNGKSIVTDNIYDDEGRLVYQSKDSRGNSINYDYNEINGTLRSVTDAQEKKTSYEYDPYLNPTKVSLANTENTQAGSVSFAYDGIKHSWLKSISLADVLKYTFDHDSFGNVKSVNKGEKKLAGYSYNRFNGKLNRIDFGNGDTATLEYNKLELLTERSYGGSDTLKYEYDNKGRLARIHDENTALTYNITYDAAERVTYSSIYDEEKQLEKSEFSSSYDKAGRQSAFSYYFDGKAFRSEYGYTTDDKISAITLPTGGYLRRIYDNIGRTATETFTPQKKKATGEKDKTYETGAEIKSTLSYLGTDRASNEGIDTGKDYKYTTRLLAGLETVVGDDTVALSDTLAYDKVGRVSRYNDTEYTYDTFGRLIRANDSAAGNTWEYSYDSIGNLTVAKSKVKGKEDVEEYSYDAKAPDEIVSYTLNGGKQSIKMGNGGNPDSYRGYSLKWHRGSELESVEFTGKGVSKDKNSKNATSVTGDTADAENKGQEKLKAEYTYSYEGIRLKKKVNDTETEYVINGSTILAQKTGDGAEQELLNFYYTPEGKLLEIGYSTGGSPEKHYTVIKNAMGDVAALYTAEGTLVGSYKYDPYGKIISVNHNKEYNDADGILEKNPFRYRGYYFDAETGWYYLNSRYYDPEVKRFVNADSTDVLTNQCTNLMQYNLFAYCNDNPVNKADDGGNLENWQKIAIGIGVIAAVGILTVATAGTGTALACFAAGAFEGAVGGAASGAVIGAATGAISSRISTG
ncbi:MAG: DNRLRE domain-containing protein, partial [Lachnospiraceae bacterium]|nr:DNRLRE domain-containing protein [Lachnospiraceae bacterium]